MYKVEINNPVNDFEEFKRSLKLQIVCRVYLVNGCVRVSVEDFRKNHLCEVFRKNLISYVQV